MDGVRVEDVVSYAPQAAIFKAAMDANSLSYVREITKGRGEYGDHLSSLDSHSRHRSGWRT